MGFPRDFPRESRRDGMAGRRPAPPPSPWGAGLRPAIPSLRLSLRKSLGKPIPSLHWLIRISQSLITYIHIHILLRLSLLGLSMFMRITGIHLSTPRKQRTYWTTEGWPAAGYESDLHVEGCECDPLIGWEEAGRPAPVPLLLATYTWGPYTVFTRISLV